MPALELANEPHSFSRYDVMGEYADTQHGFVGHVGLLDADSQDLSAGSDAIAVHMRPPLARGKTIVVHVAGRVPLTNNEIKVIAAWTEEIADEYDANEVSGAGGWRRQYIIHPPWEDERDPITRVRRYRRYSCAGFVLDAYLQVEIELLETDPDRLPEVDRQTIDAAYPQAVGNPKLLAEFGLQNVGPWRIVLGGYVLHALDRPTEDIRNSPYKAQPDDKRF